MSLAEKYKTERQPSPYKFNPEILREYDIRGQIGKDLSEEDAYALGLSFGTYLIREAGIDGKVVRLAGRVPVRVVQATVARHLQDGVHPGQVLAHEHQGVKHGQRAQVVRVGLVAVTARLHHQEGEQVARDTGQQHDRSAQL